MATDTTEKYREQHKQRLSYMPWLYFRLKQKHLNWAEPWQQQWQAYLQEMETVTITGRCFIAPNAHLFAEPGRPITLNEGSFIGAETVIHGPVTIGKHVGINHHCHIEGGRQPIVIGDHCRIASHCHMYAFNHKTELDSPIREQGVTSQGITLGEDVWLGANVGITDGCVIGNGTVVGMQSVVTKSLPANKIVAGNPAKVIKDR